MIDKIPSRTERTNWRAMQVPKDPKDKRQVVPPHGVLTRYLSTGSRKHTSK